MSTAPAFSRLNRALFWTRVVMVWERLLPVIVPFPLLALLVAVAGQWGLFLWVPGWTHIAVLGLGLLAAIIAAVRAALRFRLPSFTELNTRLAVDNEMKPERLLALRHEKDQPRLRVGKAKAGIATADPFALRYVAVVLIGLGFLVFGPSSVWRIPASLCPFAHQATDTTLAVK
ncbi:MAG: DUF4175 family protein [Asticcacaulis sp.]